MFQLLKLYMPLIEKDEATFVPQPPETTTYYPKRTPEDGGIDWSKTTRQIYNLIRAVASPYPHAFCYHVGTKVLILEAYPFETGLFHHSILPGTVVDVSTSLGNFVVKTVDGSLLVKQFEGLGIQDIHVGDVLEGVDQDEILRQIRQRYPANVADDEKEI